jgi:hypothetical protein
MARVELLTLDGATVAFGTSSRDHVRMAETRIVVAKPVTCGLEVSHLQVLRASRLAVAISDGKKRRPGKVFRHNLGGSSASGVGRDFSGSAIRSDCLEPHQPLSALLG